MIAPHFIAHEVCLVAAFDRHDYAAALRVAIVCVRYQEANVGHVAILTDDEREDLRDDRCPGRFASPAPSVQSCATTERVN
jgi:hypothetical protein